MPTYKIQVLNNFKPDWNQTDETQADYIKNKPTLGTLAEKDSEIYIGSGEMPEGYVLQIDPEGTADSIPTKTSELENDSGFITSSDLPTKTSQIENDSGFITVKDLPDPELPSVTEADNGKVLRVVNGVWNKDEIPAVSGGSVNDVQTNGTTIVTDGVANIPIADINKPGLISYSSANALSKNGANLVPLAWESFPQKRNNAFMTYALLDYSVKAAMCDGKGSAWTDAERIAALLRMGCTVDENGYVKWEAQT